MDYIIKHGEFPPDDYTTKKQNTMNEIITQLIAASIDDKKIPSLDCFDMAGRDDNYFKIILNDGTTIKVTVEIQS